MSTLFNKDFFYDNGYQIIDDIFSEDQCDKLIYEVNSFSSTDFTPLMNKHFDSKEILKFISQRRLVNIVEEYFSGKAMGLQTEFFFMPPNTQGFSPHQDNTFVQAKGNTFISAWVALTDVTPVNGGLIIWPETHKDKQIDFEETGENKIVNQDPNANRLKTVIPDKYKPISPTLKKGSVLLIDKWLVHASNTNQSEKYRHSLLCTYIKQHAAFRKGNYAKREAFDLNG